MAALQLFNITLDTETSTELIWNVPFIMNEGQVCLVKFEPLLPNVHTESPHSDTVVLCCSWLLMGTEEKTQAAM